MIKYYIVDIKELNDPKNDLSSIEGLPKERQEKCLWYILADDRKRCLGAGKIIKKIFDDFNVTSDIVYGINGKPECDKVYFNVSHSGNYVIGVASTAAIGCDIEYMKEAPILVSDTYFHNSEIEYIQKSTDKSQAFWKLWTLKESYMKMTGEGILIPLDSFEIVFKNQIIVYRQGVKKECTFKQFNFDGHSIAVCVNDDTYQIDNNISWIKIS